MNSNKNGIVKKIERNNWIIGKVLSEARKRMRKNQIQNAWVRCVINILFSQTCGISSVALIPNPFQCVLNTSMGAFSLFWILENEKSIHIILLESIDSNLTV